MSFLDKVQFWKKHEEPLPPETFGQPGMEQPSSLSSDPMYQTGISDIDGQDPMAPQPQQQSSEQPPLPPQPGAQDDDSLGRSLAQKYMAQQEVQPPQQQQPAEQKSSNNEVLNLKVDAIKSEITAVSQRLIRIEQLLEEQSKRKW